MITQTFLYFTLYKRYAFLLFLMTSPEPSDRDKLWMKLFVSEFRACHYGHTDPAAQVGLLFFCDTLNCAFDITFLYLPLVNGFGKFVKLQRDDNRLTSA